MDVALESAISKVQVSQEGLDLKSSLLPENINIQIHRTQSNVAFLTLRSTVGC